jgi:hypothetical protein
MEHQIIIESPFSGNIDVGRRSNPLNVVLR